MKPLLKWIGGKQKLLDLIIPNMPKNMNNYHELFVGGGSVLLGVLESQKINEIIVQKNIYAYDSNPILIAFYKQIQKDYNKLYIEVIKLKNKYNNCKEQEDKATYYYKIRSLYNSKEIDIEKIAMFVFLNKTGFRGLFRLNKSGGYNVPYGNYKNPKIADKEAWKDVNELIKNVKFICCDFEDVKKIKKDDFIYMDPPYVPEQKNGFVSYSKEGFSEEKYNTLFKLCHKLKCNFMMSNSNTKTVQQKMEKFNLTMIMARRAINSKEPGSFACELIITNYESPDKAIQINF